MGWLLGCFKCTGKLEGVKPKKQLSGVHHLVPGCSNSAAVAHAASPEDLRVVRKSLSIANGKKHLEKGPGNFFTSPLRDEVKQWTYPKSFSNQTEETVQCHDHDLDGDIENFRERLLHDKNAAMQLSDEVKFLNGCISLSESPSDSFKVTFDISAQNSSEHSRHISSQPGGRVIEARSKSNMILVNEGSLSKIRGMNGSESNGVDSPVENTAMIADGIYESMFLCQNRFHQGKIFRSPARYVSSPPWLFSSMKAQGHRFCTDELSDDLLMEHLDVASLIEDSSLITDWELSSCNSLPDALGSNDQFLLQVPSQEKTTAPKMSSFFEQENKSHAGRRIDGHDLESKFNCISVYESCTKDRPSFGFDEAIDPEEMSSIKDAEYLFCPEICVATEESDSVSSSQSCFSSRFRLLECALSTAAENHSDQKSTTRHHMVRSSVWDAHELLSPSMHSEKEPLQEPKWEDEHYSLSSPTMESRSLSSKIRAGHLDCTDIHVNGDVSYLRFRSFEAKEEHDTVEALIKEQFDGIGSRNLPFMSSPTEDENVKQREKAKIRNASLEDQLCEGSVAEHDDLDNDTRKMESFSSKEERIAPKHVMDESPLEPSSTMLPSSLCVGTSLSVTSFCSPAKSADERPIIGTVAAHWSPIKTGKWWDGKGIPNSTQKYQEDQKVNFHAVPFEVRLEQALANQKKVL